MPGDGTISPETNATGSVVTSDRPEPGEPEVIIAEEEKTPYQKGGFLDTHHSTKPVTLVAPGEYQPQAVLTLPENITGVPSSLGDVGVPEAGVIGREDGPPPPGGGDRGGGGGPEGPRGPRGPDYLWSVEFSRDGRNIAREIIRLEGLTYEEKYDAENGPKLDQLYKDWKSWVAQIRKQSIERRPFDEQFAPALEVIGEEVHTPEELTEAERILLTEVAVSEQQNTESDNLEGLPALQDITESDRSITEGLLSKYKRLRKEKAPTDQTTEQIREVEEQLGKYFREAKRLGLLYSIDASLGPLYVQIKKDLATKVGHNKIRAYIKENAEEISELGKDMFEYKSPAISAEVAAQLDGVWDVYTEIALERFRALLYENGGMARQTINGEFFFDIAEATFSTETGEEGLRRGLESDADLRARSETNLGDDEALRLLAAGNRGEFSRLVSRRDRFNRDLARFTGGDQTEIDRLVEDRQAVYQLLVEEREARYRSNKEERDEAVKNRAGDRDAYRSLAIERELYWAPTYANYFEVFATDEEQFQKAVDTFTQWIRSGLTKSPNELFQRVSGFKDALTTAGYREKTNVDPEFMIRLRHQLEGMIGVLGANSANERYNADHFKQFLNFLAEDEGPDRFISLGRVSRGAISALLWKFDNDSQYELLFSTHGSRGQIFEERNPIEIHRLRTQIRDLLIEGMLGVDIKGYDPRDPKKRVDGKYLGQNLTDLSRFQSDEEFQNLFEGFTVGEQETYFKDGKFKSRLQRVEKAKEIDQQIKAGRTLRSLNLTHPELADYNRYQEKKLKLTDYEERLVKAVKIRKFLDEGNNPKDITKNLGREFSEHYEMVKNSIDLALEMYGIMGEKAKRSGGVLLVDKKSEYDQQSADYIPVSLAEKFVQFSENWTKATYGGELDSEAQNKLKLERQAAAEVLLKRPGTSPEEWLKTLGWKDPKGIFADELQCRVDQARRMAIWALKIHGFDARLYDFTLLRDGKAVDPNTLGYSKYGTDENKDTDIEKHKYAVPENTRILGYNTKGEEVILVFDAGGKPIVGGSTGLEFDPRTGEAVIFRKPVKTREWQNDKWVEITVADRQPILFDNLNINTEATKMMLKTPRLKRNDDGTVFRPEIITYNDDGSVAKRAYGRPVTEEVVPVDVNFDIATRHIYSRWTGHPYWGYQEEDTGLILTKAVLEAAERIRRGESRPEDEEAHATQLLIVDPSLQRVGHFNNKESREDKIVLSAVEESYQGHWRIKEELQQAFLPDGPDVESSRTAFVMQDDGGSTKQWLNMSFEAARWPGAKIRRARSLVSALPLHFASMPEMWGAGGALNTLRMYGYEEYRMVGLFATQKWIAQTGGAQDVYDAIAGYLSEQEKRSREGYGEKPNNDADKYLEQKMKHYYTHYQNDMENPQTIPEDDDNEYINAARESMGRPEVLLQRIRVLETDMRGERAPLWLKGVDIYERESNGSIKVVNGQRVYNQKIDNDVDSGSSRHSGALWFWKMVRWQMSDQPGEGQALYPTVGRYYKVMDYYTGDSLRAVKEKEKYARLQTRWQWLLYKINR